MTLGGFGTSGENHPSYKREVSKERRLKISEKLKNKYIGKDSKLSKPVLQFTYEGELVCRYEGVSDANRKIGLLTGGHIQDACNGKLHSAHGFIWIYESDYNTDILLERVSSYLNSKKAHNRKRVVQLDKLENFICIHESFKDAIQSVASHYNSGNITKCCKHEIKYAYGYIWLYEEEYEEIIRRGK